MPNSSLVAKIEHLRERLKAALDAAKANGGLEPTSAQAFGDVQAELDHLAAGAYANLDEPRSPKALAADLDEHEER
ncbi:MAG: hypothetical protein ACREQJ_05005, partial [Candidatus Binatia bacterium]